MSRLTAWARAEVLGASKSEDAAEMRMGSCKFARESADGCGLGNDSGADNNKDVPNKEEDIKHDVEDDKDGSSNDDDDGSLCG
jgi:hypothetical protein